MYCIYSDVKCVKVMDVASASGSGHRYTLNTPRQVPVAECHRVDGDESCRIDVLDTNRTKATRERLN